MVQLIILQMPTAGLASTVHVFINYLLQLHVNLLPMARGLLKVMQSKVRVS